jgi:DNA polymerase-3 subunit beta
MQFDVVIPKNALSPLLGRVASAVKGVSSVELFKCFLLTADANGKLTVRGTDLVSSISATTSAEVKKPGMVAVTAELLADAVSSMPAGDVALSLKDWRLTVKAVKGKAKHTLPARPGDDFPVMPKVTGQPVEVCSADLGSIISRVAHAQGDEKERAMMACVELVARDGELRAAATDGHRLAIARVKADALLVQEAIPTCSVKTVERLCAAMGKEMVAVSLSPGAGAFETTGHMRFSWPGMDLVIKRGDKRLPDLSKAVEQSFQHRVRMPRHDLIECIKRAQVASEKSKVGTRPVHLEMANGAFKVSAETADRGDSSDELDVDYAGEPWKSGAGSEFLLQALAVIVDDDVLMCINPPDHNGNPTYIGFVGATDERATFSLIAPMAL